MAVTASTLDPQPNLDVRSDLLDPAIQTAVDII